MVARDTISNLKAWEVSSYQSLGLDDMKRMMPIPNGTVRVSDESFQTLTIGNLITR
jgi:hypothetical protein